METFIVCRVANSRSGKNYQVMKFDSMLGIYFPHLKELFLYDVAREIAKRANHVTDCMKVAKE